MSAATYSCLECRRVSIPSGAWRAATKAQRDEWTASSVRQGAGRGLCRPCWMRLNTAGLLDAKYPAAPKAVFVCLAPGCERVGRTLCYKHAHRMRDHGTFDLPAASPEQRFWEKVKPGEGDCWIWAGALRDGYGVIRWNGRAARAHRVAYELMVGEIPDGLVLDHLCRLRSCVNPYHLDPVTDAVNISRGVGPSVINARKIECKYGHPYTEENTYRVPKTGSRQCRKCGSGGRDAA